MIEKISWEDFQKSGMFWWVNRVLHVFGLALVMSVDENKKIKEVYPARCKFRGFATDKEEQGFRQVTSYLESNIADLKKEAFDE